MWEVCALTTKQSDKWMSPISDQKAEVVSQKACAIISKNLHLPAFLPPHPAERFFALDWAARTQSLRTKFGRRRVPRLAIFSRTIARLSPLGETRKGTSLPICVFKAILRMGRVCCRIRCMLRTHRLLAADKKVLRVRISLSPP